MNKRLALGQLGFEEGYDFTIIESKGVQTVEWLREVNEPTEAEMTAVLEEVARWTAPPTFSEMQQAAKNQIDRAAEEARLRYITAGSGQAIVYQEKASDAERHKADGYPESGLSSYPWIKAEMDATGQTPKAATDFILAQRTAWVAVGTEIEKNRRFWKLEVDKATDEAGVEFAKSQAMAALEAL